MNELKEKLSGLKKIKYPLFILALGLMLMLLPSGSKKEDIPESDMVFQQILSASEGVGEARVIISESGVVVVCRGAEDARVRLNIIRAISSYTGFSSDKITVLKLED